MKYDCDLPANVKQGGTAVGFAIALDPLFLVAFICLGFDTVNVDLPSSACQRDCEASVLAIVCVCAYV